MFADVDGSGSLDFQETYDMMQRMIGAKSDPRGEVAAMFSRVGVSQEGFLTYEEFLLLLNECEEGCPLFEGLLVFARDVVAAGVQNQLRGSSASKEAMAGRSRVALPRSHILDDGSQAWRDSIEAAFELSDEDGGGTITKEELDSALIKYPLMKQLLRLPMELDVQGQREYMRDLFDSIDEDGSNEIDRGEWVKFFCPARESVPRPTEWDPENP